MDSFSNLVLCPMCYEEQNRGWPPLASRVEWYHQHLLPLAMSAKNKQAETLGLGRATVGWTVRFR